MKHLATIGFLASCLACSMIVTVTSTDILRFRRAYGEGLIAASVTDYETAEASLLRALEAGEELASGDPDRFGTIVPETLESLAEVFEQAGQPERGVPYLRRALADREARFGADDGRLFWSLDPLARALVATGHLQEGLRVHERALEVIAPFSEPHDERLAASHRQMGAVLLEVDESDLALVRFERALEVRQWVAGSRRYDIATTLDGYADALDRVGRHGGAEQARDEASVILDGSDYFREIRRSHDDVGLRTVWSEMPIRVWVDRPRTKLTDDPDVAVAAARRAVRSWEDLVDEGVPRFEFVERGEAQIRIRWDANRGRQFHLGITHWRLYEGALFEAKIHVALRRMGVRIPPEEVEMIVQHEIGHALGLTAHSPYPPDLMYHAASDSPAEISDRDRRTLQRLYQ